MRHFHFAGRSSVHSLNGMVATSHPQASLAAIDTLRAGGTAADAAVAAAALLAVIEPQSTGIGGDGFGLYQRGGEGPIVSYNGSGRAPQAATAEWFLERGMNAIPLTSAHSVTVPGVVDLWATILRDHGRFGLDRLMQPAIEAAENGYVVAPRIAFDWANAVQKLRGGINTPRYLLPGGKAPVVGDVIHQKELGKALRAIATQGPAAFYTGEIAEDVVATLRAAGGLHTLDDFATHTTETTTPLGTDYKGYRAWQCPPNGPGITMLVMLNILRHFDLTKYAPMSVERFHLEAEAARVAYMMREMRIGDPGFVEIDIDELLSDAFATSWADKIRMDALLDLPTVSPPMNPSTVYITVVDRDRNVCSFINSVAHSFASAIVSDKTGILLQNRGAGFRVQPGHPNCIAPGKRPLHTIIPSLLTENGRARMSFGVMGGQYQPVGQVRVATNVIDYGMDVQEALDQPRGLHYEGVYQLEDSVPADIVAGLQALGHKTAKVSAPHGGGQAIWIDWERGALAGGSEPRKDGCALGY